MELTYLEHLIFSVIASAGYAIYIYVPKGDIGLSALNGGVGWVLYKFLSAKTGDMIFSYFLATLFIGFAGNIFSYKTKRTALVYILPGIVPLVPGYNMYYTMFYMVTKDFPMAAQNALDAVLIALSIASAVLVMESLRKLSDNIVKMIDKSIKMGNEGVEKIIRFILKSR